MLSDLKNDLLMTNTDSPLQILVSLCRIQTLHAGSEVFRKLQLWYLTDPVNFIAQNLQQSMNWEKLFKQNASKYQLKWFVKFAIPSVSYHHQWLEEHICC